MLQCLSLNPSSSSTATTPTFNLQNGPLSQAGTSSEGTPLSSSQLSPAINLESEYARYVQTNSFNEMRSRIHVFNGDENRFEIEQIEFCAVNDDIGELREHLLVRFLEPNPECVRETLDQAKDSNFTRHVSGYFSHSENTTYLCLKLQQSVFRARALYDPIYKLLDSISLESVDGLDQLQCDCAYDLFRQFDCNENPFPSSGSRSFSEMHECYSQLRCQLDKRLSKSRSRVGFVRRATAGSVLCVIGAALTVALSAVAIASHALVAIVACPVCALAYHPRNLTRKELAHVKQLDEAAKGAFALNGQLQTIDSLVSSLHIAIDCDKHFLQLGLDRGSDQYVIFQALKWFQKNRPSLVDKLIYLENSIHLCVNYINKARSSLHEEINLYHSCRS